MSEFGARFLFSSVFCEWDSISNCNTRLVHSFHCKYHLQSKEDTWREMPALQFVSTLCRCSRPLLEYRYELTSEEKEEIKEYADAELAYYRSMKERRRQQMGEIEEEKGRACNCEGICCRGGCRDRFWCDGRMYDLALHSIHIEIYQRRAAEDSALAVFCRYWNKPGKLITRRGPQAHTNNIALCRFR
jgi:hypothetical protein